MDCRPDPGFLPGVFAAADQSAQNHQQQFLWLRGAEFGSLAIATLFGAVSVWIGWPGVFAVSLSLCTAVGIRWTAAAETHEENWYRARALAESVKSTSWQFATGGEAFPIEDAESEQRLRTLTTQIVSDLGTPDLPVADTRGWSTTNEMRCLRGTDLDTRLDAYLKWRVKPQLEWYTVKAKKNRGAATLWRRVIASVEVAAIVAAIASLSGGLSIVWALSAISVAAAMTAWVQTRRYSDLAAAYTVTTHDVARVADRGAAIGDENVWATFVHDAEAAFSREHTVWLARRQRPGNWGSSRISDED